MYGLAGRGPVDVDVGHAMLGPMCALVKVDVQLLVYTEVHRLSVGEAAERSGKVQLGPGWLKGEFRQMVVGRGNEAGNEESNPGGREIQCPVSGEFGTDDAGTGREG